MSFVLGLTKKHLARFEELIAQGENLYQQMRIIPGGYRDNPLHTNYDLFGGYSSPQKLPDRYELAGEPFIAWRTSCTSLLDQILPAKNIHRREIECFRKIRISPKDFDWGIGMLKALKVDYESGFLGDLISQIEAEFSADYLRQAERLLNEGSCGKFDHIPGAVLAGAVLEKALRDLCNRLAPPIPTVKHNGSPKGMMSIIDDLKKAGAYSESKAKKLRSWADTRNSAAHGKFDECNRLDVEQMLRGIKGFLAEMAVCSQ